MNRLIPSIASANPLNLEKEMEKIRFMPALHLDIEDGNFIPNITFGLKTIQAIAAVWEGSLDAHLLVKNPMDYIDDLAECGIKQIAVHLESLDYPLYALEKIQKKGIQAGIALNPGSNIRDLEYLLPFLDYVLLMSSEPDGRGQAFLEHTYQRVANLKMMDPKLEIWVDGGIGENEAVRLFQNGADKLILGRAIFHASAPQEIVEQLIKRMSQDVIAQGG